jgi:protein ImuB
MDKKGVKVCLAMAPVSHAACALARFTQGGVFTDIIRLRRLPVTALPLAPKIINALVKAGLKTIDDIATRPRAPLAARFGAQLLTQLDYLLGHAEPVFEPHRPQAMCREEQRFFEPVSQEADIQRVLHELAAKVDDILETRGQGGRLFQASFFRTDGHVRHIAVRTSYPVRAARRIANLFKEKLSALSDEWDAGFGFDLIRLSVLEAENRDPDQISLDGYKVDEEALSALIDRLGARFGMNAVKIAFPVDTHIPERAQTCTPPYLDSAISWQKPQPGEPPRRPVHLFDPPQLIDTLAEVPDGPPLRFRWRRVQHAIRAAEGPERIAREWWQDGICAPIRDYYRVEDNDGRRFWLFREGLYGGDKTPKWYVHGLFG